jgi:hypothetical protein
LFVRVVQRLVAGQLPHQALPVPDIELDQAEVLDGNLQEPRRAGGHVRLRCQRVAYGSPFTLRTTQQVTPLRPRTISLGLRVGF